MLMIIDNVMAIPTKLVPFENVNTSMLTTTSLAYMYASGAFIVPVVSWKLTETYTVETTLGSTSTEYGVWSARVCSHGAENTVKM